MLQVRLFVFRFFSRTELVICKGTIFSIFKYYPNVGNETFTMEHQQTFNLKHYGINCKYDCFCGICHTELDEKINYNSNVPITSEDEKENKIIMFDNNNGSRYRKYEIVLFGNGGLGNPNFRSSLQWLSLYIDNINNEYYIEIDTMKTNIFQNTFVDDSFTSGYNGFGYTKWKHYLILFGGWIFGETETNVILCFDFYEMKWFRSSIVEFFEINLCIYIIYTCFLIDNIVLSL